MVRPPAEVATDRQEVSGRRGGQRDDNRSVEVRGVFCSQCGQPVPADANFCPSCGSPLGDEVSPGTPSSAPPDSTTASIDVGEFDPRHEVEELPDLEPGTGMLVVVRGPNAGSRFLLDRETTTIGRHPDSDIFLDDVTVSRRHAEFVSADGGIVVRDLGSLNGSYVNGDRVEERELGTGDEVQIGRFKLLYVGDAGAAMASPPPGSGL